MTPEEIAGNLCDEVHPFLIHSGADEVLYMLCLDAISTALAEQREKDARIAEDGLWVIDASHAEGKTLVYSREIAAAIRKGEAHK